MTLLLPQVSAEDAAFFRKRLTGAAFLLQGGGLELSSAKVQSKLKSQQKRERKLERLKREANELQGEEQPRQSRLWKEAADEELRQGLPLKLADGSLKKVTLEKRQSREDADDEVDENAPPLSERARKKLRKQRAAELLSNKDAAGAAAPASAVAKGKQGGTSKERSGGGEGGGAEEAGEEEAQGCSARAAAQGLVKGKTTEEKKAALAHMCTQVPHPVPPFLPPAPCHPPPLSL